MRSVYLYGHLKKAFGPKFRLNVDTPGEAIRLLNAGFPGFEAALRKGWYRLVVGPRQNQGHDLDLEQVEMRLGRSDFHLVPVVGGSGKGGVLKAILGTALVGAAIFFSGGTLAAPLAGLAGAVPGLGGLATWGNIAGLATWGNIAGLGLVTALAGVAQMIAPTQKSEDGTKKEDSFGLSGPLNMQEQGYPVPVVIGEVITGGIPISSGFDVFDIPIGAS